MPRYAVRRPRLRRISAPQALLLAMPLLLVLGWSVSNELDYLRQVRAKVRRDALHAARVQAEAIAGRLDTQFSEMHFAAVALADTPVAPSIRLQPSTERLLRDFVAQRSHVYAFNIQSVDGKRILWSTDPVAFPTPLFRLDEFTALPGKPDFLLGKARFSAVAGDKVFSTRVRVRDVHGAVRFTVGSPYRVSHLIAGGADIHGMALVLRDRRNGHLVASLRDGQVDLHPAPIGSRVESYPVPGYPLDVLGQWSTALEREDYLQGALQRWAFDLAMLAMLGGALWGVALLIDERDTSLRAQRRLAGFNAMLAQASQAIASAEEETELLEALCRIAVVHAGLQLAVIARPDDTQHFVVLAAAGATGYLEGLDISSDPDVPGGQGPTGQTWRDGMARFNGSFADTPTLSPWHERARRFGLQANATLPIRRGDRIWAVLTVYHEQPHVFDERLQAVLQELALDASRGLDRLDTRRRLAELQREEAMRARHDALTGLPNRYALDELLPDILARAARDERVVAVGMLDLDDFKPVNDAWGHEAGDALLRELGRRLRQRLRQTDLLARVGGDEFVVVMPDLDSVQPLDALGLALARLHEAVDGPLQFAPGRSAEVGMSMGVALFPQDAQTGDGLLRQADAAMYQAKANKQTRAQWWRLAGGGDAAQAEPAVDAYGPAATALLEQWQGLFEQVGEAFHEEFFDRLAKAPELAVILDALSDDERQRLGEAQREHLRFITAPRTTQQALLERAARIGRGHVLVGVDAATLVHSIGLYRELLTARLSAAPLTARTRFRLLLKSDRRLQDDMQSQLGAREQILAAYNGLLGAPLPPGGSLWADVAAAEIETLGRLPGIRSVVLMRLNSQGELVVVQTAGPAGREVAAVAQEAGNMPELDPASPRGHALSAEAWRSMRVQSAASYALDKRYAYWRGAMLPLGVRSAMAIPLLSPEGHVIATLAFHGAYPNQFGSSWMQRFASSLKRRWEELWVRCSTPKGGSVLAQDVAESYRHRLFSGGLTMYVQPVVDLRDGSVSKLEALARLRLDGGSIVSPGVFLPVLGNQELDRVFCLGLDQALEAVRRYERQGLQLGVALNLPPATLLDPECPGWVEQALARHGVAPRRLTLELLETQDVDQQAQAEAIARLLQLGVQLAMDDLGSGYSSLKRLSVLPFHTVKIDQELLGQIRVSPLESLSLIATLVQMGRDLDRVVVVEGLEDLGMIEAAAALGAPFGQGYGLARPMPIEAFDAWLADFRLPLRPGRIQTWLGALAVHWDYLHARAAGLPRPLELCPLTAFLAERGLAGSEVGRWHALAHAEGADITAARPLLDWLVDKVREEAQDGARQPARAVTA